MPVKWLFFEQVARLTGSPVPPRPDYANQQTPLIRLIALESGQTLEGPAARNYDTSQ